MGILGRGRNIPWPSGKQISKKPDRNSSHFLEEHSSGGKGRSKKRGRGGRKLNYAILFPISFFLIEL